MKKTLLFIGASVLALAAFGGKKVNDINTLANSLVVSLKQIQNIKFTGSKVVITVALSIKNPTKYAFSFSSGSLLTLKHIYIYKQDGTLLAEASVNISGIEITPLGETIIKDIDIEGDVIEALNEYLTTEFKGNYKPELKVSTFGKEWLIS